MSPEVVRGERVTEKCDIWAVGCTVWEMLKGKRPWSGLGREAALYNIGRNQHPPLTHFPQFFSNDGRDFLQFCFTIEPENRPSASMLLKHRWFKNNEGEDGRASSSSLDIMLNK